MTLMNFDMAMRHDLLKITVINENGVMNENAGTEYEGLDRFECREKVVMDLKERKLLDKIEDYQHNVGHCYRCKTVIEPYLSNQWFVKMKPLAEKAMQVIEKGRLRSIRHDIKRSFSTGWKIFVIGVFPVKYGGGIEFRFTIVMTAVRS